MRLKNKKTDCFGFDSISQECTKLYSYDCEGCRFYKTWEELEKEQKHTRKLLRERKRWDLIVKYIDA